MVAYHAYYAKVFAFVYSRVRNVELARDLTSEIFEKAYVKGHTVREQAAYGGWLFTIARNLIAGHYRKARREMGCAEKVKGSLRLFAPACDPADQAVASEQFGVLTRNLRTLPQRDQELISLKYDSELTYQEIAQVMGMTEVNVRVSSFRALQRLRDKVRAEAMDI